MSSSFGRSHSSAAVAASRRWSCGGGAQSTHCRPAQQRSSRGQNRASACSAASPRLASLPPQDSSPVQSSPVQSKQATEGRRRHRAADRTRPRVTHRHRTKGRHAPLSAPRVSSRLRLAPREPRPMGSRASAAQSTGAALQLQPAAARQQDSRRGREGRGGQGVRLGRGSSLCLFAVSTPALSSFAACQSVSPVSLAAGCCSPERPPLQKALWMLQKDHLRQIEISP
jgi:hypothetical protein